MKELQVLLESSRSRVHVSNSECSLIRFIPLTSLNIWTVTLVLYEYFYLRRRRRKQVQECSHLVRLSVRLSVPKSCHRNLSETTDPIIMKLGMQIGHHMQLCILAGNFDPLIFVGVMHLGTQKILRNDLVIATPLKLLIRFS